MNHLWLFFILILYQEEIKSEPLCPMKCSCTKVKPKVQFSFGDFYKLKCGTMDFPIQELNELSFNTYPNIAEVSTIDLAENELSKLPLNSFAFPNLQKLDLNKNQISIIEPGAFLNLTNLKTLILSNNKIDYLSKEIFEGLSSLENLKLAQNSIAQLREGTFVYLQSITKIDLSSNPFLCDCELLWLYEWAWNNSVKLNPPPKCHDPPNVRNQYLQRLHSSSPALKCNWLVSDDMQIIEMKPSQNQIVFEGDSLRLQCRVLNAEATDEDTIMNWSWGGQDPNIVFDQTVQIESKYPKDSGVRESTLIIDHITKNHSGKWNCEFMSGDIKNMSTISVFVLSEDTKYCPSSVTTDNKGTYTWPKTVVDNTAEIPCTVTQDDDYQDEDTSGLRAIRVCSSQGEWLKLNTSQCPFMNPNTRLLQHFSKMNLTARRVGGDSLITTANKTRNFVVNELKSITDHQDIVFITHTIENYLEFVSKEKELGAILIDITSNIMKLPKELLSAAQMSDRACSRLVSAIETITAYTPTLQSHKSNLAVEEFRITRESFFGITCSWYSGDEETGRFFLCDTSNKTAQLATKHKIMEASVQMPPSLFYQIEMQGYHVTSHQLMIAMYENAQLFPRRSLLDGKHITSSVVGIKLVDLEVNSLTDPVYVIVRAPANGKSPGPAWWDQNLGDWRTDGCQMSHYLDDLLVFQCYRLGYFALIENIQIPQILRPSGAVFRFSHPTIYIGTFVGVTCLLIASLTYIVCYSSIQMAKKMKHSLANTWISMSLFCLVFSIGARQTENERWCQWIGVILHFFCLSSLFWMAVTVKAMYKRLPKPKLGSSSSSDDLPHDDIVIKKPILGIYMVGYGISLIICGLSSAVNMRGYAGHTYCFLSPGPALSAIIIPSTILLIFLSIMCLLVRCIALNHLDSNAQLSDGTQATDLELMETTITGIPTERTSLHSVLTPSSQLEDTEHSPLTHLKAFIIVLLLYITIVICAALSTMTPLLISYEEVVFSIIYCIFCILLGIFILFFYCFNRLDVRNQWFKIKFKSKPLYRSRNIIDSNNLPLPMLSTSMNLTPNNHQQIKTIVATELNNLNKNNENGFIKSNNNKNSNLNLILLKQRHTNEDKNIINNFYNPHQSTAARKFFKKQRKKQNNLILNRKNFNDSQNIYNNESKINNTNIHVDQTLQSKDGKKQERYVLESIEIGGGVGRNRIDNDGTLCEKAIDHTAIRNILNPQYIEVNDKQSDKLNECYSTEEFVTSHKSEESQSEGIDENEDKEKCNCSEEEREEEIGWEENYEKERDLSCKKNTPCCNISCSHIFISDGGCNSSSDISHTSSHLYATVASVSDMGDSSLERKPNQIYSNIQYKIYNNQQSNAGSGSGPGGGVAGGKRNKNQNIITKNEIDKGGIQRRRKEREEDKRETCL